MDKWIAGAIKHPGALRRTLKARKGQPIPAAKLKAAAHSRNARTRRRAQLAMTLKKMNKG